MHSARTPLLRPLVVPGLPPCRDRNFRTGALDLSLRQSPCCWSEQVERIALPARLRAAYQGVSSQSAVSAASVALKESRRSQWLLEGIATGAPVRLPRGLCVGSCKRPLSRHAFSRQPRCVEYRRNRDALVRNRAGFARRPARTAHRPRPRPGPAPGPLRDLGPHTRVRCARAWPPRIEPARDCYRFDAEALACHQPTCTSVRGDIPDAALARSAVGALNRESTGRALAVSGLVVTIARPALPEYDATKPSSRPRLQKRSTPRASSRLRTRRYTAHSC